MSMYIRTLSFTLIGVYIGVYKYMYEFWIKNPSVYALP